MIKRGILFLATLALMVSPAISANAATIYDAETTPPTGGGQGTFGDSGASSDSLFAQSFTTIGASDTFNGNVSLKLGGATSGDVSLQIFSDSAGEPNVQVNSCVGTIPFGDITGSFALLPFDVVCSGDLGAATQFWMVLSRDGGAAPANTYFVEMTGGDLEPSEEAKVFINAPFGPAWFSQFGGADVNMIINDAPPATANEIVAPFDTEVITELPFAVNGTCDFATQNTLAIFLRDNDTNINIDSNFINCENDDTWDVGTMGSAVWNTSFTVTLYDVDEGNFGKRILPALDFHTVTVDVTGNTNDPPPVIDAGATDQDFGFLGNLIRDALIFLFIPSPESLGRFSDLFEQVGDKPPIGFITVTVAAFEDLEVGTPVETLEGTAALSDYFDPIRGAISAFLFLLFALYLINRVSRITI